jgi:hypothetical protein
MESSGISEHGNKPSGSTEGMKFLRQLSDYHFVKNSAAWSQTFEE